MDINVLDVRNYTPLHVSAAKGTTDAASVLIDLGASLRAKTLEGYTPAHLGIGLFSGSVYGFLFIFVAEQLCCKINTEYWT